MKLIALFFGGIMFSAEASDYRKGMVVLFTISAILLILGCATLEQTTGLGTAGKTAQLRPGMEYKQVEALLGTPKSSQTMKGQGMGSL
jgi:outer membrane protein assembly factor BamE (lipoprotein component of BamABCDE complex)